MELAILNLNSAEENASFYSKLLLRVMLKKLGYDNWREVEIYKGENGKPFIKGDLNFNISHCEKVVLCAVDFNNNIGVDIEKIKEIPKDIFEFVFHQNELKIYKDITKEQFYKLWTLKEAYSKYTSKGLSENFATIDTTIFNFQKNVIQWIQDEFVYSIYADNINNLNIKKYSENEIKKYYD